MPSRKVFCLVKTPRVELGKRPTAKAPIEHTDRRDPAGLRGHQPTIAPIESSACSSSTSRPLAAVLERNVSVSFVGHVFALPEDGGERPD
jgi:hypothetical protein